MPESASWGGGGLDLIPLNFPLGCGPGSDPPQFLPWVWAWTWSPSISPLGVGLDLIPLNFPLGCGSGPDPPQFPPWCGPGGGPPSWGISLAGGHLLLGGGYLLLWGFSFLGVSFQGGSPSGGPPSWGSPWWGVLPPGGCLLLEEGGLLLGGASLVGGSLSGGPSSWGVSFLGGLPSRGVPPWGRGWQYPSMHWGRPPPMDRITDTSKNITLATTSLRPVIMHVRKLQPSPAIYFWCGTQVNLFPYLQVSMKASVIKPLADIILSMILRMDHLQIKLAYSWAKIGQFQCRSSLQHVCEKTKNFKPNCGTSCLTTESDSCPGTGIHKCPYVDVITLTFSSLENSTWAVRFTTRSKRTNIFQAKTIP